MFNFLNDGFPISVYTVCVAVYLVFQISSIPIIFSLLCDNIFTCSCCNNVLGNLFMFHFNITLVMSPFLVMFFLRRISLICWFYLEKGFVQISILSLSFSLSLSLYLSLSLSLSIYLFPLTAYLWAFLSLFVYYAFVYIGFFQLIV